MKSDPSSLAIRNLRAGAIEIDLDRRTVSLNGSAVELSAKEFDILRALVETKGTWLAGNFSWRRFGAVPAGLKSTPTPLMSIFTV